MAVYGVDSLGFMSERRYQRRKLALLFVVACRFESVGEIDTGAFVASKAVAGLVELEADLHVGNGVRSHVQLVAVQAREKVRRHVLVPRSPLLRVGEALLVPPGREGAL